ncbi:hypothetical protein N0V93_003264 [Gnomoniopsis smithogilvyi]|uniref:Major facilitator superfamily (MFS) profile domain-containing protein n=1 Tax=Gnomoniopsis smithogilvyi TaxID=1191159 RepID=A0A9W9CZQ1_9PEZI|nr:hypothetical protein N0V93_003264 [Gnomoniopsis smithogilvyi]
MPARRDLVDFRNSWPVDPKTGQHYPPPDYFKNSDKNNQSLEEDGGGLSRYETVDSIDKYFPRVELTEIETNEDHVLGSTNLLDKDGNIRLIPTPTPDPRDPMNLPDWRKWFAVGALCLFGSISLAAEIAIAGLTPVFLLEYSGVTNPAEILKHADLKNNPDPTALIPPGASGVSLSQISLLATIPLLSNGFATYLLVPLSTAVGRRPVLILTSTLAWTSGFWAGASTSLYSHIGARVFHGLGSGAVEALIPLIIQDLLFIHQRNKAMAAVFAAQGPMIITFGILGPWIAVHYTWRWLYFITSGFGIVAWILLLVYVPESRKARSKEELAGMKLWDYAPGKSRPDLDYVSYAKRSRWDDVGFLQYGIMWREAGNSMVATVKTIIFPAIIWTTLLQAVTGIIMGATGQVLSFALLGAGIPFELTGLANLSQILSTGLIFLIGGPLADKVNNWITRRRGGIREPENQLPNLVLPIVLIIVGAVIFGVADQYSLHYMVLLTGNFFLGSAPLMMAPIIQNFVIESYPQHAGPVLVNVSTLRVFIGFGFNTVATTWFSQLGPLQFMIDVSLVILLVSTGIPILFIWGKKLRLWTSGKVKKRNAVKASKPWDEYAQ